MKPLLGFFHAISWPIALHAAQNLLLSIGIMALVGFIGTMHYYLAVPSAIFLLFGWWLLYKIEYGWRARRTFGREA